MKEVEIIGYDGKYTITDTGDVYSYTWNKKRKLKGQKASQSKGYLQVRLFEPNHESARRNKKGDKLGNLHYIHRLVYTHFIGDIPKHLTVDHIDSNPRNNHISNLQLLPIRTNVNAYHRKKNGRILRDLRDEMIEEYKKCNTYTGVANKFNCSITSAHRIIKDRVCTYNHTTGKWSTKKYSDIQDKFVDKNLRVGELKEKMKDGLV